MRDLLDPVGRHVPDHDRGDVPPMPVDQVGEPIEFSTQHPIDQRPIVRIRLLRDVLLIHQPLRWQPLRWAPRLGRQASEAQAGSFRSRTSTAPQPADDDA